MEEQKEEQWVSLPKPLWEAWSAQGGSKDLNRVKTYLLARWEKDGKPMTPPISAPKNDRHRGRVQVTRDEAEALTEAGHKFATLGLASIMALYLGWPDVQGRREL